jgi:Transcriptional regulator
MDQDKMDQTNTDHERPAGIQVISRAAKVMRVLADHPEGLSLAEIAKRVALPRSTVQRIIQALESEGFAEPAGPAGGFQLGAALSELVYRHQVDIVSLARPFLEALSSELGETVTLCMLSGMHVSAIDRVIAEQPLRVVFPLGTIPHPTHLLAPGRALLADLPEQARLVVLRSLVGPEAGRISAELAHEPDGVKDQSSFIPGLVGFAVPMQSRFGRYAITVILPDLRTAGREAEILTALRACRDRIVGKAG